MMLHRMPKPGDRVRCPKDMGQPAFVGVITFVGPNVTPKTKHHPAYVWCTVKRGRENGGVWPSHRLGYKIEKPQ